MVVVSRAVGSVCMARATGRFPGIVESILGRRLPTRSTDVILESGLGTIDCLTDDLKAVVSLPESPGPNIPEIGIGFSDTARL